MLASLSCTVLFLIVTTPNGNPLLSCRQENYRLPINGVFQVDVCVSPVFEEQIGSVGASGSIAMRQFELQTASCQFDLLAILSHKMRQFSTQTNRCKSLQAADPGLNSQRVKAQGVGATSIKSLERPVGPNISLGREFQGDVVPLGHLDPQDMKLKLGQVTFPFQIQVS